MNTHLESHARVTDQEGNRVQGVSKTGIFSREDQIVQIREWLKAYKNLRPQIKWALFQGDLNWDDQNKDVSGGVNEASRERGVIRAAHSLQMMVLLGIHARSPHRLRFCLRFCSPHH